MAHDHVYPKYFDLDGTPVRRVIESDSPEIYRGGGRWDRFPDTWRIFDGAVELDKSGFDELIKEFDETLAS